MTHRAPRPRAQGGQSLVIFAGSIFTLMAMLGMVVAVGFSYTDRRHLQTLADAAALSGATYIGVRYCDTGLSASDASFAFSKAGEVIWKQLAPAGSTDTNNYGSLTGGCTNGGWTFTGSYPNNVTVTMNFPYKGIDATELMVFIQQPNQILLSAFFNNGNPMVTVTGRAVAKHLLGTPAGTYALFALQQVACQGNVPANVSGSIYAGQGFSATTNCSIYAHAIGNLSTGYHDFGNMVTPVTQSPANSPGAQSPCTMNICADGYQIFGSNCGVIGQSMYLDSAQLPSINPNPCPTKAPTYSYPRFDDPNTHAPYSTSSPMCNPTTNYSSTQDPGYPDPTYGATWWHFRPGCYSGITLNTTSSGGYIFDPGLYYFNGPGLTLPGGSVAYAKNVTMEFANGASFDTGTCGSPCSFGSDPSNPSSCTLPSGLSSLCGFFAAPESTSSNWCTTTPSCPDAGLLIYQDPNTGTSSATWSVRGPKATGYFKGSVFWPNGLCTWWANSNSQILGQMACLNVALQGGAVSIGGAIDYASGAINIAATESALVE